MKKSVSERFWAKVDVRGADECWPWLGAPNGSGYGWFNRDGRVLGAHRVSYELVIADIPAGMEIDHLCRNKACVNPAHLEPVTKLENMRRWGAGKDNAAKTHCRLGHPYAGGNLFLSPDGRRQCRECARAANRRSYAKRREARP